MRNLEWRDAVAYLCAIMLVKMKMRLTKFGNIYIKVASCLKQLTFIGNIEVLMKCDSMFCYQFRDEFNYFITLTIFHYVYIEYSKFFYSYINTIKLYIRSQIQLCGVTYFIMFELLNIRAQIGFNQTQETFRLNVILKNSNVSDIHKSLIFMRIKSKLMFSQLKN